ncbi:MAG: hypothetical protein HUJ29_11610 [Gammaproteobacteria bacterium]|nr:hypothetical protein [Gammaproteobacteria bacterium]
MKSLLAVSIIAVLLSACGRPYIQDKTPPLKSLVAAGDSLVLKREVTFLPTDQKVRFQYSEQLEQSQLVSGLDKYEAACRLSLTDAKHYKRLIIPPQTFTITRIESYTETAGLLDMNDYGIRLWLKSTSHPMVHMLECYKPDEIYRETPFTVRMFEIAVGDMMNIKGQ